MDKPFLKGDECIKNPRDLKKEKDRLQSCHIRLLVASNVYARSKITEDLLSYDLKGFKN